MTHKKKIQLDRSKLLGFKIAEGGKLGAKLGAKLGGKVGQKPSVA